MPRKKQEKPREIEINLDDFKPERTSSFQSIYANNVGVSHTPWDIRLEFGELNIPERKIEAKVAVSLNPDQASRLMQILNSRLALWQKTVEGLAKKDSEEQSKTSTGD
jgi:hypothetical protein